jgi:soluble lytic murein transglycosylase
MIRPARVGVLVALFVAASLLLAGGYFYIRSSPMRDYLVQEVIFAARFSRYDSLIAQAGARHGVNPSLVKAVIWRETRFQPQMQGSHGERGLMQITEVAAADWVKAEKVETFVPTDLFDPKTNIEIGTWYLGRAIKHWAHKDDPIPFALSEYNAGRTRVKRWEKSSGDIAEFSAEDLRSTMDFPLTKQYVASIIGRYQHYLKRGEFSKKPSESAPSSLPLKE